MDGLSGDFILERRPAVKYFMSPYNLVASVLSLFELGIAPSLNPLANVGGV